ncbi:MAG: phosphorylase kinase [Nitrospira sp.]
MKPRYSVQDVNTLISFLRGCGTFRFEPYENGLFPAAAVGKDLAGSGYNRIWVRDNVHVSHALHVCGAVTEARINVETLAAFFRLQAHRFDAIARGDTDPRDAKLRPPIRFRAETLTPDEDWANAQNDAIGYFLWIYARLVADDIVVREGIAWDVLALFPPYLRAISYWRDEDSGHWEEMPKVSASSIGVVVAGLRALLALLRGTHGQHIPTAYRSALRVDVVEELLNEGTRALAGILPAECVDNNPLKQRRYDAALLFLIYPLDVVDQSMANQIVDDVCTNLGGDVGVRRYICDSFWCTDYRRKLTSDQRTRDWSEDMATRDALVRCGEEAEWCLFDPVLSLIAGAKFRSTRAPAFLDEQIYRLNRSLGHLTEPTGSVPELRCPELYHREDGRYETSDATPLLWTQALLLLALWSMHKNAELQ